MAPKKIWTIEKVRDGFERFMKENGRLPTTPEIDKLDYLPSSRQIERRFGGAQEVRKLLSYQDTHLGKGKFRSEISGKIGVRGRKIEIELEKVLKSRFGEVFVHTEKIFDRTKNRVDFYVYSPDGNFGIDVFYADTFRNLQGSVNIKIDKYLNFPEELYFVAINPSITQEEINEYMKMKKKQLPQHSRVLTQSSLLEIIEKKRAYPSPF